MLRFFLWLVLRLRLSLVAIQLRLRLSLSLNARAKMRVLLLAEHSELRKVSYESGCRLETSQEGGFRSFYSIAATAAIFDD